MKFDCGLDDRLFLDFNLNNNKNTMNDLNITPEDVLLSEEQTKYQENYEAPIVEIVEIELEGTILNTSDYATNRFLISILPLN